MKLPSLVHTALLALVVLSSGCVETVLRMTNATGGTVDVWSGHTKQSVSIAAGRTVDVPHTGGTVSISRPNQVWRYDELDVFDYRPETIEGIQKLTLPLDIHADGTLTLPSGRKIEPSYRIDQ